MKINKFLAILTCLVLLLASFPLYTFADDSIINLTAGDVLSSFVPAGTECLSNNPDIAWVDSYGNLNSLKAGTTNITVAGESNYTVTVNDYSDGSETIGNLKILARFNDSMQFYDGHVYLLFTSYQDGVEVSIDDLYAAYEISDEYYKDINDDIANGSNHTGSDAEKYFTFNNEINSVTLNRGEIVTIGMYRDFDLTVPQAAIGSIKNSSAWSNIEAAGKTAIVESIFQLLDSGSISMGSAIEKIMAACADIGLDYNKLLDGVVPGGVCFNRELYNQKLEWDQFENVTYELDITKNQFDTLMMYLNGNLNKFSILKNSCATVALRAWNAAIGSRNGKDTSYKLSHTGSGIFSLIDAPKSVRDSIVNRLPGYYLNNSSAVTEPGAGYIDDTGYVYVSAPKKVSPIEYIFNNNPIKIDAEKTKMSSLVSAAKKGNKFTYKKDNQQISVDVNSSTDGDYTTVDRIDFTVNEKSVSVDSNNMPESGAWFKVKVDNPIEGENYVAFDKNDNALLSDYNDGYVSFYTSSLPATFKIGVGEKITGCILKTHIVTDEYFCGNTEVYYIENDEKISIDELTDLESGTKVFIKSTLSDEEYSFILHDILLNNTSILDTAHYSDIEDAYYVILPDGYSTLDIIYAEAYINDKGTSTIQVTVGDQFNITDHIEYYINGESAELSNIDSYVYNSEDVVASRGNNNFEAVSEGFATLWVYSTSNENIGTMFNIEVFENTEDMVHITYDDEDAFNFMIVADPDTENSRMVAFNNYLVKKGTPVTIVPFPDENMAVLKVLCNGKSVGANESVIITEDTKFKITFAEAHIEGVPETIYLTSQDDTYQLNPIVKYNGSLSDTPIYDSSIIYESGDSLVEVDENGLITVAEPIPEDGSEVIVTAYAGSTSYRVFAECKVILGDKKLSDIVGKLTIWARPIVKGNLMPHASVAFTTYEDVDLDISYYKYYKPNSKYNDLMIDYELNPDNYTSDPALYNNNELGISDRESYFDVLYSGPGTDPQRVSLKAGETISMSNYGYENMDLKGAIKTLRASSISASDQTQELIRQMQLYADGQEIDGTLAFDSLLSTLMQVYMTSKFLGINPIDGRVDGGIHINREMYNQFIRNDSQLPNNSFTVEITVDELAKLKKYLSDPENNYYAFFTKNCATSTVEIWNSVFADKPELQLKANFTGLSNDPESLYFELARFLTNSSLSGKGSSNVYPRTVAYIIPTPSNPDNGLDTLTEPDNKADTISSSIISNDYSTNPQNINISMNNTDSSNNTKRSPITGDINSFVSSLPLIIIFAAATMFVVVIRKKKEI